MDETVRIELLLERDVCGILSHFRMTFDAPLDSIGPERLEMADTIIEQYFPGWELAVMSEPEGSFNEDELE